MRTQIKELLDNAGFPSDDAFIDAIVSVSKQLPRTPISTTKSLISMHEYFRLNFEWDDNTHWDMLEVVKAFIPWSKGAENG